MEKNTMIIAKDQYYSLDCYKTQLNNNVLVVGAAGTGKTRSIVTPNLLQATGSYVITDPKGNLYDKYAPYLRSKGYKVRKLDFTDPKNSHHYNFFNYIHSTQDIVKIAHMMVYQRKSGGHLDPFWDEATQLLLQSLIAFLVERDIPQDKNIGNIQKLINLFDVTGDFECQKSPVDILMEEHEKSHPNSYAVSTYTKFRVAASKTLRSILISFNAKTVAWNTPEIQQMLSCDDMDISSIGKEKTALFVIVSDNDRSLDGLANVFYTQAMNELCHYADKHCKDNRLPVPVRFILDDFATNCTIGEFPRMIASIRSRGISTMLMIQAESQLREAYGEDGRTIIGNCDTYVYLGGNDIETAKAVAERCDKPLMDILCMPVGTNWIFRRGQRPINGTNFELEPFLQTKKITQLSQQERDCW